MFSRTVSKKNLNCESSMSIYVGTYALRGYRYIGISTVHTMKLGANLRQPCNAGDRALNIEGNSSTRELYKGKGDSQVLLKEGDLPLHSGARRRLPCQWVDTRVEGLSGFFIFWRTVSMKERNTFWQRKTRTQGMHRSKEHIHWWKLLQNTRDIT